MKIILMFKQEFFAILVCFVIFLMTAFGLNYFIVKEYKTSFLENNAILINGIIKMHPEFEYDVMRILKDKNPDTSLHLLKKYSYDDYEALENFSIVKNIEQITRRSILVTFLFGFFLFFGIILFFYFRKKRRIEEINDYLFSVLQNDYSVDLKDYREDGISNLKIDVLKVTNKLRCASEDSLFDKKNLERTLSDISHQLRTPLTSLYIIHDALRSKKLSEEKRCEFLNQQREQLERMEWLVVTLLKMSQIDSGTILMQRKKVFIHELILESLKPLLIMMELKEIDFELICAKNLTGKLDFNWTVESLINLIKNAVEHTKKHGNIKIMVEDNPMFLEIILMDSGSGIKKEELVHIFERFYKGNTKSESIGIGLNLSKTIIEKQNGTIQVESIEGKGTKFVIRFYKVTV